MGSSRRHQQATGNHWSFNFRRRSLSTYMFYSSLNIYTNSYLVLDVNLTLVGSLLLALVQLTLHVATSPLLLIRQYLFKNSVHSSEFFLVSSFNFLCTLKKNHTERNNSVGDLDQLSSTPLNSISSLSRWVAIINKIHNNRFML